MHNGETFKILRKWKKISQKQLAQKLKTSQQYISELEKKENMNSNTLDLLLKGLDCNRELWQKFLKLPLGGVKN